MREANFRDYVRVLVKWRKVVLLNVLVITGFAVVLSLVLPKKYTAKATLLPPLDLQGMQGIGSVLGRGMLADLGGSAGLFGMASTSDIFAAILGSNAIVEEVVRKCDLVAVYEVGSVEDAAHVLRQKTGIVVSPEGLISIAATASAPELAARIANTFVEELDRFNRETTMTIGKRQRIFLEGRLSVVKESLRKAEDALREFQKEHHTVSLTEELSAAIEAAAHLKAEIISKEIQLGVATKYATEENPEVKRLTSQIQEMRRELRKMEYGTASDTEQVPAEFGAGFSVPFAELPEVGLELARLTRDAKIQEEIYALLTQEHEQAKIAEVKDTPTVQRLDRAVPPERRSYPQRRRIVMIAGVLSIFVGIGMAFFWEYLEGVKGRPDEYRDWQEIFGPLRGDLRSVLRRVRRSLRRR